MNQARTTTLLLTATLLGSMGIQGKAFAGSEGRKNTTAVLGAITAHELIKGRTNNAILTGAGTVVAYNKYKEAKKDEDRYERRSERRDRRDRRSRVRNLLGQPTERR
ncbi:MAG: hypothetical protein KY468_08815 [Armatimonadetes bacterium]|nr:hypothetical protein [Armatimonadota bacterium]